MISKEEFFKYTLEEINNIKKHATPEEISKLDIDNLDPSSSYGCIYGLMTGNCNSDRAYELIKLCATSTLSWSLHAFKEDYITSRPPRGFSGNSYTCLEACIYSFPLNNPEIIEYLKGDTTELRLT